MGEDIILKWYEHWWYFVLLLILLFIVYKVWNKFVDWHLDLEKEKNKSIINSFEKLVEHSAETVKSIKNNHYENSDEHRLIIAKIDKVLENTKK